MKKFKEEFWKETSKLIDAHRKDNDERAAQGVVDCRILFTRLVKNLTTPCVSNSVVCNIGMLPVNCYYRNITMKCKGCKNNANNCC